MKKMRGLCLLLVLLLVMQWSCMAAPEETTPNLAVTSGCLTLDGGAPLYGSTQLLDSAKAAILYELDSQTLVYAWNPDEHLDPSGMNKIMTALLALEMGDPDATVTVTKSALDAVAIGSVSANLKKDEQMTLGDLLYCMMVGSANDAAAVIAEYIGGSQADFVALMNERAVQMGCTNTQFMNPHGLHHDDQYTTARDLAKITAFALENQAFVELFSAISYTVPATNKSDERNLETTNYMMSQTTVRNQFDERVTGGKTGALSTTDRSLIASAEQDGLRYLTVVMSAAGKVTGDGLAVTAFGNFTETRALLDHGFGGYAVTQLLQEGQVMEQYDVSGGANDVIASPSAAISVTLPVDAKTVELSYRCTPLSGGISAPVRKGDVIGTVEIWFRTVCVGQCDLIAMFDVDALSERVIQPTGGKKVDESAWLTWLPIGCGVILGGGILAGGVMLTVRAAKGAAQEKRRKNRRKNRQRSR